MSRRDDELILFFYGEHEAPAEVERELAADPELARRYETLKRELGSLRALDGPPPRPGLEGRLWARVAPELSRPGRVFSWRWAAAAAVLVVAAFLAGWGLRTSPTEDEVASTLQALPPEARDRVLQAALADHLESSQRFLMEIANGAPSLEEERESAASLLSANRLYRRAAGRAGERRVAAVLTELEVLLADLAEGATSSDPRYIHARAESEDLLFKVRIARNNLKGTS